MRLWGLLDMYYVCFYLFLFALCSLYGNYIWWEQMCRLIGVSSSPSSALAPLPASHPYYLSWQYNQCFLPMLLNVFLLALIASFSLHCNSKWVWQITTIYLPRYTGFLCRPPPPPHIGPPAARRHHSRLGNLISQKLTSTFGQREGGTKSQENEGKHFRTNLCDLLNHEVFSPKK